MRVNPTCLLKYQAELEAILERLHMIPVGSGFFELICPQSSIAAFLDEMDRRQIQIAGFSWWCHVTEGHEPCGMGGPRDKYGDGWYSEIELFGFSSLDSNDAYRRYFTLEYPQSRDYRPCRVPAFSLEPVQLPGCVETAALKPFLHANGPQDAQTGCLPCSPLD